MIVGRVVGVSNFSYVKVQCKLILNESFTGKVLNGLKISFHPFLFFLYLSPV